MVLTGIKTKARKEIDLTNLEVKKLIVMCRVLEIAEWEGVNRHQCHAAIWACRIKKNVSLEFESTTL